MGQEIGASRFSDEDFRHFAARLEQETGLFAELLADHAFSHRHGVAGFELEAWLVDRQGDPAPINEAYLALLDDALLSPELSRFNVELNSTPLPIQGDAFSRMHDELANNWQRCRRAARQLDAELMMIGILPSVTEGMLTLDQMSAMERYRALNEQVLRLRQGRPLILDIQGEHDHLHAEHGDVMLEAATTSFQLHLQVDADRATRYYNALQALAGPMVAVSANSPLLFGHRLWQETRVVLFEQAVAIGGFAGAAFGPLKRVSFGSDYLRRSVLEIYRENLDHFPVLLPVDFATEPEAFAHLRLHNGTIWRWNRPLIGFDADGTPHLRIEHRVMAAGPSVVDSIANAALFFGLAHTLAEREEPIESLIPFSAARDNFYRCAQYGLDALVHWDRGQPVRVRELLTRELLPMARSGLERLDVAGSDIEQFLEPIEGRLRSGQNGARWQLTYFDSHGSDPHELVAAYRERQESGLPVYQWSL